MFKSEAQVGRGQRYTRIANDHFSPQKIFMAVFAKHKFYWQACQGLNAWGEDFGRFHICHAHNSPLLGCIACRCHTRPLQAQSHHKDTLSTQIHTALSSSYSSICNHHSRLCSSAQSKHHWSGLIPLHIAPKSDIIWAIYFWWVARKRSSQGLQWQTRKILTIAEHTYRVSRK